jgi:hypothetical protein
MNLKRLYRKERKQSPASPSVQPRAPSFECQCDLCLGFVADDPYEPYSDAGDDFMACAREREMDQDEYEKHI